MRIASPKTQPQSAASPRGAPIDTAPSPRSGPSQPVRPRHGPAHDSPRRIARTAFPARSALLAPKGWARRIGVLSALLFAVAAQGGDWEWGGSQFGIDFSWRSDKPCADETSELRVKVENRRAEGVKVAFRVWNSYFDRSFTLQMPAGAVDTTAVVRAEAPTCYPAIDNVRLESWEAVPPMAEAAQPAGRPEGSGGDEVLIGFTP